jgi:SulP family sulfate permease
MESPRTQQPLFLPKLLSTLKSYSLPQFTNDLSSGLIVGIVALPLAIAFAIASGVTPDRGLTTAIIAGFLISALGGSKVQIGGPTGAFVVIVYGIVQQYGVNGLILCTLMAGVLLILMGSFRLGAIIKFIPYPLTVGFTAGIAVVIFSSQVKDFLGLKTGTLPADFIDKWKVYFENFHTIDATTFVLSILSLLIILLWPRIDGRVTRKIPGSIVAILIVTALVHLFHIPVETIGSRFGAIPSGLPHPVWPHFTLSELRSLMGPALTVALLGAIESLLSATVADGMIESRHRSNTELIAQGVANLVTPIFGGIPATGAIARTATNVKNGGRTPVAGMVHSLTLLLIMLLFGRWAKLIPLSVLAAILIVISYHMSEWHAFKNLLRAPKMDVAVLLTTFLLTVLVDLTAAVEIGMLMSVLLFMKRMTDVTKVREVTQEMNENLIDEKLQEDEAKSITPKIPPGVVIYEAEGAFFFGVTEYLRETLNWGDKAPRVMILRMRHVLALDASGIRALDDLRKGCTRTGTQLILEGIHAQPLFALDRAELLAEFGEKNVVGNLDEALNRAHEILRLASLSLDGRGLGRG